MCVLGSPQNAFSGMFGVYWILCLMYTLIPFAHPLHAFVCVLGSRKNASSGVFGVHKVLLAKYPTIYPLMYTCKPFRYMFSLRFRKPTKRNDLFGYQSGILMGYIPRNIPFNTNFQSQLLALTISVHAFVCVLGSRQNASSGIFAVYRVL